MAAAFAKIGYQSVGVDFPNKDQPECGCMKLDLRLTNLLLAIENSFAASTAAA